MSEQIEHVFVYGSLKSGKPLYFIEELMALREQALLAMVKDAALYDLGPFPGMVIQPDAGNVLGEVHRFRSMREALAVLDEVESYYGDGDPNNLYRRVKYRAELLDGGGSVSCWLYEYVGPLEGAEFIESGVWNGAGEEPH